MVLYNRLRSDDFTRFFRREAWAKPLSHTNDLRPSIGKVVGNIVERAGGMLPKVVNIDRLFYLPVAARELCKRRLE